MDNTSTINTTIDNAKQTAIPIDEVYVMSPAPVYTQITSAPQSNHPPPIANQLVSNEMRQIIYEFEFQYTDNPRWLRTDAPIGVAFTAIQTGLLGNKPISKIKLFTISEGMSSVSFIYDIAAAKQGNSPWSLLPF